MIIWRGAYLVRVSLSVDVDLLVGVMSMQHVARDSRVHLEPKSLN